MSAYEMLYQCYRSGQMSERQWQEHLNADEVFRSWLSRHLSSLRSEG